MIETHCSQTNWSVCIWATNCKLWQLRFCIPVFILISNFQIEYILNSPSLQIFMLLALKFYKVPVLTFTQFICIQSTRGEKNLIYSYIDERRVLWNFGKYGIPRFQLWLVLLFRKNIMNYSRRTPTIQYSKKWLLILAIPFSTD